MKVLRILVVLALGFTATLARADVVKIGSETDYLATAVSDFLTNPGDTGSTGTSTDVGFFWLYGYRVVEIDMKYWPTVPALVVFRVKQAMEVDQWTFNGSIPGPRADTMPFPYAATATRGNEKIEFFLTLFPDASGRLQISYSQRRSTTGSVAPPAPVGPTPAPPTPTPVTPTPVTPTPIPLHPKYPNAPTVRLQIGTAYPNAFGSYLQVMTDKILTNLNWALSPVGAPPGGVTPVPNTTVYLDITLHANGALDLLPLPIGTASSDVRHACLQAVTISSPFDPWPNPMNQQLGSPQVLHLTFQF